jgi:MoaA/NifB/PqqE/SkfB family radical SAM enzyme
MEWTSKCNARCIMCPQSEIQNAMLMRPETFDQVLLRLKDAKIFRVVIAGYGEPTTHPSFNAFINKIRKHPVRFDMVSNGHLLDEEKLRHLDGAIGTLVVSFSSIDPAVYRKVHVNLDHDRVKENILRAHKLLKDTKLAISLTPLPECMDSLEDTIAWFKKNGIEDLTMSPTLYNRGGNVTEHDMATERLRAMIKTHRLHSQEFDFVPGIKDIAHQFLKNKFKCIPRNVDLFIASNGNYLYCYNDISHTHGIGNVVANSIDEVLHRRESMGPVDELCNNCNMRDRYKASEIGKVVKNYTVEKLVSILH